MATIEKTSRGFYLQIIADEKLAELLKSATDEKEIECLCSQAEGIEYIGYRIRDRVRYTLVKYDGKLYFEHSYSKLDNDYTIVFHKFGHKFEECEPVDDFDYLLEYCDQVDDEIVINWYYKKDELSAAEAKIKEFGEENTTLIKLK